ncbi:hypothetical protein BKA70DRAFT_1303236 [Coprinopsis sp. MPI-PUGE-AT-0042]|nr:hypothetical protein BKA70DRAFT_1303236 [Coprinopsis sp. MPI-PUGE-AT-0042]
MAIPTTAKGIIVRKSESTQKSPNGYINDAVLVDYEIPHLQPGQVLVKMLAVGFNHKDVWIRKGQYPGITQGAFFGGDGMGVVVASADTNDTLVDERVFLAPSRGWKSDPRGPESRFTILGCGAVKPGGTFAEYIVVERENVIKVPPHLDDVHAAAWPLGGVTAWRATMVNARVEAGHKVLITGIGGGVALLALQFCVAAGASVYVTSGNPDKLKKAIDLGAKGGASYKDQDWPAQIKALMEKEKGALLDSVIDSSGGEILSKVGKILRHGGKLVCYGMTAGPKVTFTMLPVLANHQLLGSTMGSQKDLEDATAFMDKHKIVPIISHVLEGFENAEEGFQLLHNGEQFGKVIIRLARQAKL